MVIKYHCRGGPGNLGLILENWKLSKTANFGIEKYIPETLVTIVSFIDPRDVKHTWYFLPPTPFQKPVPKAEVGNDFLDALS